MIIFLATLLMIACHVTTQTTPEELDESIIVYPIPSVPNAVDDSEKVRRLNRSWFNHAECGIEWVPLRPHLLMDHCFELHNRNYLDWRRNEHQALMQRARTADARITGGSSAFEGLGPWTAIITGIHEPSNPETHPTPGGGCTGSLLTTEFVLTAAHCVWNYAASNYEVWLSVDPPIRRHLQRHRVIRSHFYPCSQINGSMFDPPNCHGKMIFFNPDVALLQISPVQPTLTDRVHPASYYRFNTVCMADTHVVFHHEDIVRMFGWGGTLMPDGSEILRWFDRAFWYPEIMPAYNRSQVVGFVLDSSAFFFQTVQHQVRPGDSGSPVVIQNPDGRWYQVGVISGANETRPEARFTTITHPAVRFWINHVIRNHGQS